MAPHIAWREWSPQAFAEAAAAQRPVLLSLVTAWSDACAAMDRTTFANAAVASEIAARFVSIRVDADRRPDVNERYNLGGWPTTAFLTSEGDLLGGGTYIDADRMLSLLREVADACRDRASEIAARAAASRGLGRTTPDARHGDAGAVDADPVRYFRDLVVERADRTHGGFGSAPKLPHPHAVGFALSLAALDPEMSGIAERALDAAGALWDGDRGGFRRYAEGSDWSGAATEKTLEDNASLLHVLVEAAIVTGDSRYRDRAAAIVTWARTVMWQHSGGCFSNAAASASVDRSAYVDTNAMMIGALIRAAALFDDVWLRDFALQTIETVVVPAYTPGNGVGHVAGDAGTSAVRGLLTDQIHVSAALIWAHAATGQLPYSMLAAELLQFAIRAMGDEVSGCFRDRLDPADPLIPFELNCHAACALDRLASLTGASDYRDRAQSILASLANQFFRRDLFGAPYAAAVREVIDGRRPAGLELAKVDWKLG